MLNDAGLFTLLAASMILTGCAAPASWTQYTPLAKDWEGKKVSALIQTWGPPTEPEVERPDGSRVYTWFRWWATVSDSEERHSGLSSYRDWTRASGATGTTFCKTVVKTSPEAVIKSMKQEGNCENR